MKKEVTEAREYLIRYLPILYAIHGRKSNAIHPFDYYVPKLAGVAKDSTIAHEHLNGLINLYQAYLEPAIRANEPLQNALEAFVYCPEDNVATNIFRHAITSVLVNNLPFLYETLRLCRYFASAEQKVVVNNDTSGGQGGKSEQATREPGHEEKVYAPPEHLPDIVKELDDELPFKSPENDVFRDDRSNPFLRGGFDGGRRGPGFG